MNADIEKIQNININDSLSLFFNSSNFGVCLIDQFNNIEWGNDYFFELFKKSNSEFKKLNKLKTTQAQPNSVLTIPLMFNNVSVFLENIEDNNKTFETTYIPLTTNPIKYLVIFNPNYIKPVSDFFAEELYSVFNNFDDPIAVLNTHGQITYCNNIFNTAFKLNEGSIPGKKLFSELEIFEVIDDELSEQIRHEINTYNVSTYKLHAKIKINRYKTSSVTHFKLVNNSEQYFVLIFRDYGPLALNEELSVFISNYNNLLNEIILDLKLQRDLQPILKKIIDTCRISLNLTFAAAFIGSELYGDFNFISENTAVDTSDKKYFDFLFQHNENVSQNLSKLIHSNNEEIIKYFNIEDEDRLYYSNLINNSNFNGIFIAMTSEKKLSESRDHQLKVFTDLLFIVYNLVIDSRFHKDLEDKLRVAQKFETSYFIQSGILHDFNNINLTVSLLLKQIMEIQAGDPELYSKLNEVNDLLIRGSSLVKTLNSQGKIELPSKTEFLLSKLLNDIQRFFIKILPAGIRLILTTPDFDGYINGDYSQLHQVLTNIIFNAKDAIKGNGEIQITCKLTEQIDNPNNFDTILISISDNGSGIESKHLEKIFDPYFTTKANNGGTGLGLYISNNIIKEHGGSITVSSIPNQQTNFSISLPIKQFEGKYYNSLNTKIEKILIVDDEVNINNLLKELFESSGYVIGQAFSGKQTIDIINGEFNEFQLILIDYFLSDLTALEVLKTININKLPVKVIVASGLLDDNSLKGLNNLGITKIIQKPYDFDNLLRIIESI